jgi:hypothetical protein
MASAAATTMDLDLHASTTSTTAAYGQTVAGIDDVDPFGWLGDNDFDLSTFDVSTFCSDGDGTHDNAIGSYAAYAGSTPGGVNGGSGGNVSVSGSDALGDFFLACTREPHSPNKNGSLQGGGEGGSGVGGAGREGTFAGGAFTLDDAELSAIARTLLLEDVPLFAAAASTAAAAAAAAAAEAEGWRGGNEKKRNRAAAATGEVDTAAAAIRAAAIRGSLYERERGSRDCGDIDTLAAAKTDSLLLSMVGRYKLSWYKLS